MIGVDWNNMTVEEASEICPCGHRRLDHDPHTTHPCTNTTCGCVGFNITVTANAGWLHIPENLSFPQTGVYIHCPNCNTQIQVIPHIHSIQVTEYTDRPDALHVSFRRSEVEHECPRRSR